MGVAPSREEDRSDGGGEPKVDGDGAVRDAEGDGAPAVGGRSGAADGVGGNTAKRTEATPSKEEVRSGGGGGTELSGGGGESGARREHECDGESERRAAETEERSSGKV
jgi:Domain of unknown function (DUF834).